MAYEYQTAVYIGRFQPVHKAHLDTIERALGRANSIIVFVGSAKRVQTVRNPFTFEERRAMLRTAIRARFHGTSTQGVLRRVTILPLRDYMYNDGKWVSEVYAKATANGATADHNTCLTGCFKDDSSYYLEMFPKWSFEGVPLLRDGLSSTDIRENMFENAWALDTRIETGETLKDVLESDPSRVLDMYNAQGDDTRVDTAVDTLKTVASRMHAANHDDISVAMLDDPFGFGDVMATPVYEIVNCWTLDISALHNPQTRRDLVQEHAHYRDYKEKWSQAPYPPTFTTTDCVVVKSGCVLLVKRAMHPGKGLWALPGGFLDENEKIQKSALRELREETSIEGHHDDLVQAIEEMKVYDHPRRSLRGRTITFCHLIDLGYGQLPDITAGPDTAEVRWIPLADVWQMEGTLFEDHGQILTDMLSRY